MTKVVVKQGYRKRIEKLGYQNTPDESPKKLSKSEASRETRKRKKIYITLLEKKLEDKQQEIERLKMEIQELKENKESKPARFHSNLKQRAKLFDSISDSIKKQDQAETKSYLDMLRNKLGVAGQDREHMLYNILKQFTELLMPMHARYLIEQGIVNTEKQFYELFSQNSQYKLHMNFNFLNKDQKKELSSIRPWLCKYKECYKHIVTQIINLHMVVQEQNILLQQIIDNLEKAFSPCFVAEFLLKLDQKRNSNQIGVIFPTSYFEEVSREMKEKKRLEKVREVCSFSIGQGERFPNHNIFNTMQDDFDYLL